MRKNMYDCSWIKWHVSSKDLSAVAMQLCQIILSSSTEAAHRPRFSVIPRLELSQWSILVSLQQVLRRPPLVVILAL